MIIIIYTILSQFSSHFKYGTFKYFIAFIIGFIRLQSKATVTQIFLASGLKVHFTNLHRFLSKYKWDLESIQEHFFKFLLKIIFSLLGDEVRLAIVNDDTKVEKTGKKQAGVHSHFDHNAKEGEEQYIKGHNWVSLGLVVRTASRILLFPLNAMLYKRAGYCEEDEFKKKPEIWVEQVKKLSEWVNRKWILLCDAFYSKKEYVSALVKEGHTVISRLRWDSAIFTPFTGKKNGRGRPKKYGERVDFWSLQEKASNLLAHIYGRDVELLINTGIGILRGWDVPVRWVCVWLDKSYVLLFSTDLSMSALEIVEWYACRWKIEVGYRDSKQVLGFGDYQIRSELGINRYVNLNLLSSSILTLVGLILEEKKLFKIPDYSWYHPKHFTIGLLKLLFIRELERNKIKLTSVIIDKNLKIPFKLRKAGVEELICAKL